MHHVNRCFHDRGNPGIVGHAAGIGAGRKLAGFILIGYGSGFAIGDNDVHETGINGVEIEGFAPLLCHFAGVGRLSALAGRRDRRRAAFRVVDAPLGLVEDLKRPEMQVIGMTFAKDSVGVRITALLT